jgi:uncharacterized protein
VRTFVIPVRDLTASGEAFEFTVSRDWQLEAFAGSEIRPVGEGRIAVQASMSGRDVWVHGKVEVAAEGTCVRCLEPAQLALVGVLERMYVAPAVAPPRGKPRPARAKREEEEEEEEGEVPDDLDAYDGENVVLDEAVREQILLEVPMNPLCREDCPGLAADTEPAVRKGPFEKLSQIVLPKKE